MRDARTGTTTRAKKKKPTRLPPLTPRGMAIDVTPRGKKVSLHDRGAAMLMRQSFETYQAHHDNKLGPGQQAVLRALKQSPTEFLKPENSHYLAALSRPSAELKKAIDKDPHAKRMHKMVLQATVQAPAERRLPAVDRRTNEQGMADVRKATEAAQAKDLAHPDAAGFLGPQALAANIAARKLELHPATDWVSKLEGGAMQSIIGTAPFIYHMATNDPRKTIPEVGGALKHSFGETITHPIRQLKEDPFSFFSNVTAPIGAGVGVTGRVGSLTRAVAGRAAGESAVKAGIHGFTHPQVRSLIDLYESKSPGAQVRIAHENGKIMEQIADSMDAIVPKVKGTKGRAINQYRKIRQELRETRAMDRAQPHHMMDAPGGRGFIGPVGAHVGAAAMQSLRELTDGVRAGTIYLRPAYLPNNWAGNLFMNMVHQGFLAPVNLAKSVYMHRQLNARQLRGIRAATGQTPIGALHGTGRGYIRALTDPVAHAMGRVADQPFRDASFLHEARRRGYRKLSDVKALITKADNGDTAALQEMADIGRKAQEEIVKFAQLNPAEQAVARQVFFVYNWMKGATRYAGRFPLQHPIQTSVLNAGAQIGNADVQRGVGGLPPYLVGSIPVGHGKLSNPFALNPLGTAVQVGRAAQGTLKELAPGQFGQFDKHTMEDWTSLISPVFGGAIEARDQTGGRGYVQNIMRNIAPYKLYQGLAHPGTGSTFPGTRAEAVGHYVLGSLYPRKYDPKAMQAALERMNINHPEKLIPDLVKKYEKATGEKMPPELISAYRKDLHELKAQKDFKTSYAHDHNSPSYRRLPAVNKAQSAIDYLDQHHVVDKATIQDFKTALETMPNDEAANEFANSLWSITNVGAAKRTWNEMMKITKQGDLTKAK